jgi:hypothetical protein
VEFPGYDTKRSVLEVALEDSTEEKFRFLLDAGVNFNALAYDLATVKQVHLLLPPGYPFYEEPRLSPPTSMLDTAGNE